MLADSRLVVNLSARPVILSLAKNRSFL